MDSVSITTLISFASFLIGLLVKLIKLMNRIENTMIATKQRVESLEKRIFDGEGSLAYRVSRLETILLENKQNKRKRKKSNE